ncbi:hypothetical protein [Pseudorhodoplanes sinuspersici]|uniref:Uncharacterized protein n=1 Tax=Pseudorhodoplanes sinuspersici TaxID=1235591 RepID=A0A1W6ZVP9_9HYPH|nr:hypothetical protein [Pseudorhodoplanes sinuspersici]ARQ01509.1 hypothetical protein CAK95_22170 [Pseudorhodoplanes sinuspersici]RKE73210.1 hypothetical protein DFP91_1090 [Pseudorhodoplanes sinuspersici]
MPTIALPTFLKILGKSSPQKVTEYSRYLKPGGYNFYHSLHDAAYAHTIGGESFEECLDSIKAIPRVSEQKYNVNAFKQLGKWITKSGGASFFAAPATTVASPKGHITVKLQPAFGCVISGERWLLQLFYAKDATLSRSAVSLGKRMMEKHLAVGDFADCKVGILDLRKREVLSPQLDELAMDLLLDSEFGWIDSFFEARKEQVKKAAA